MTKKYLCTALDSIVYESKRIISDTLLSCNFVMTKKYLCTALDSIVYESKRIISDTLLSCNFGMTPNEQPEGAI
jgi:hypothetical protein